jgi:hypothetical protein
MSSSQDHGGRQLGRDADDLKMAKRVPAVGRDPDQMKVRDVASKQRITLAQGQDLGETLRMIAKHQECRS